MTVSFLGRFRRALETNQELAQVLRHDARRMDAQEAAYRIGALVFRLELLERELEWMSFSSQRRALIRSQLGQMIPAWYGVAAQFGLAPDELHQARGDRRRRNLQPAQAGSQLPQNR